MPSFDSKLGFLKGVTMRIYKLKCIHCNEEGIYANVANPGEFKCSECEDEFLIDEVREFIEDWSAYLADYDAMIAGTK